MWSPWQFEDFVVQEQGKGLVVREGQGLKIWGPVLVQGLVIYNLLVITNLQGLVNWSSGIRQGLSSRTTLAYNDKWQSVEEQLACLSSGADEVEYVGVPANSDDVFSWPVTTCAHQEVSVLYKSLLRLRTTQFSMKPSLVHCLYNTHLAYTHIRYLLQGLIQFHPHGVDKWV